MCVRERLNTAVALENPTMVSVNSSPDLSVEQLKDKNSEINMKAEKMKCIFFMIPGLKLLF